MDSSRGSRRKRPRIDATDEIGPSPNATVTTTSSSASVLLGEGEAEEGKWRYQQQRQEDAAVCDTSATLRMMCAQFPLTEKLRRRPFALRSQLYSTLRDRTQVDRDLQSLKMQKVIRLFKLNTGQDDHAVMFMDDYLSQIETTKTGLHKDKIEVFDWFKNYVIDSKLDVSIEHGDLCSLLSLGGKVVDEHVSLLINSGLLTRQLTDSNTYWFAIPNIGTVLKGLSQGRKEIISLLQRRKFKEMPLVSLEKKRLRFSSLDMRFHLRDLIGSGHLKTHHTPIGIVVRISRD